MTPIAVFSTQGIGAADRKPSPGIKQISQPSAGVWLLTLAQPLGDRIAVVATPQMRGSEAIASVSWHRHNAQQISLRCTTWGDVLAITGAIYEIGE